MTRYKKTLYGFEKHRFDQINQTEFKQTIHMLLLRKRQHRKTIQHATIILINIKQQSIKEIPY